MCEKILLIDGHSILNRAFYGLPDLTNSEGLHTGAVYGFLNILFKVLGEEKPEYLAVAFDRSEPTFRHAKYPEYKGTRKPMPQELKKQIPLLKEMLEKMGIATVSLAGFEADDILGTLAKKGEEKGYFEFGGSTIVLLLQHGKVRMDSDLIENSENGYETIVRMGERIGKCKLPKRA